MGFLKSLKGKFHDSDSNSNSNAGDQSNPTYQQPPAYQPGPPQHDDAYEKSTRKSANLYSSDGKHDDSQDYVPPPGPPPSHFQPQSQSQSQPQSDKMNPFADNYDSDPRTHQTSSKEKGEEEEDFLPPSGPPPSHLQSQSQSQSANPPPYQDWYTVPDNSLLPPPPSMQEDYSPANNASVSSKDAGFAWCDRTGVYIPASPSRDIYAAVHSRGNIGLTVPVGFKGRVKDLSLQLNGEGDRRATKRYVLSTTAAQDDVAVLSALPLYFSVVENPLRKGQVEGSAVVRPVQIGFQVQIKRLLDQEASVAISFSNAPYPPFRLPGWHRGSLAIHSDDGRKYVNDSWGGSPFTHPFQVNDTLTLKATIHPEFSPVQRSRNQHAVEVSGLPKCRTRIELERYGPGGEWVGGWDVSEERDERMEGVDGLQGDGDLYAAIGICGGVEAEIRFWPQG